MKQLIFTVTNELVYDQRMIRICSSLAAAGYQVTLVGVQHKSAPPLSRKTFQQKRLTTWFRKGPGFYAEYNCRLFFYLLFAKADLFCCIDLDTILPVWLAGIIRNKKRVYDAHEYFSQQKEIVTRPRIHAIWHWIEKKMIPRFANGYTVGYEIAAVFQANYGVRYEVIRNMPFLKNTTPRQEQNGEKYIVYQGAVNEARGMEYLIPAMQLVDAPLFIYGDGNFLSQTKTIISSNNLSGKVLLKGKLLPEDLDSVTANAYIGINLVENIGLNQYFSLANKFFDYIQHLVPQVTMNFPEYQRVNEEYGVALLLDDLAPATIAAGLNRLLNDTELYNKLLENCISARQVLNWQEEEKKLVAFYHRLFAN